MLLSPTVRYMLKPCSATVARVAEQRRQRPLSEVRMYSPEIGLKVASSLIRDTEKLSSWLTSSVKVPSGFRSNPAPSAEPPKTKFGEPGRTSSLLIRL